ncbi:hypothetical protein [Sigmofec virus UA08Rod_4888]|uniref:Uncharacterized protein n=1 Tax=Sigmofec virus UA08Rod_4888 TaxID=2929412 RepID=A0A976R711_9VIRU|nr:hypothetical protein [Sigmofec virus UA08Rod_4888]
MKQSTESPELLNTQDQPAVTASESTPQPSSVSSDTKATCLLPDNEPERIIRDMPGTPFQIVEEKFSNRSQYFLVFGRNRMHADYFEHKEDLENWVRSKPYDLIFTFTAVAVELILAQRSND